jgi:hypothetical protein
MALGERLSLAGRTCKNRWMRQSGATRGKRGPIALAELVGRVLDPVTARRGFATAELIAVWPEIVGSRYADCSRPERIAWPRGKSNNDKPGTLVIAVEGPRALLLQHEADQIVERVNGFLGYGAIGRTKIVQGSVSPGPSAQSLEEVPIEADALAELEHTLGNIDGEDLRSALDRLGRAILAERNKKT